MPFHIVSFMRFPDIRTFILCCLISRRMVTRVTSKFEFFQSIEQLSSARVRLLLVIACLHFLFETTSVKVLECMHKYPEVYIPCTYK